MDVRVLLLLVCLAVAPTVESASEGVRPEPAVEESDAERLRALGYVEFANGGPSDSASGVPAKGGVTRLDLARAARGHTLVVSSTSCEAQLIALDGVELHRWSQQGCRGWWGAALMRSGDLIVNGSLADRRLDDSSAGLGTAPRQSRRFAARIAWTGEVRWIVMLRSHHQLDLTQEGEIVLLTEARLSGEPERRAREWTGASDDDDLVFHDNLLRWLSVDGEIGDSLSLFDAVLRSAVSFPVASLDQLGEGSGHVGLFHCNSVFAMDQPHLMSRHLLYSPQNLLVTLRNQNRIMIVDREKQSLLWAWGEHELQGPHHATWLANGRLLVFDNGIEREHSRVLEVDPLTGSIAWQYPGATGEQFFTRTRGLAQRLTNGNTLIGVSNAGRAFEVTAGGEVVWEFHTPRDENEERGVISGLRRYSESWVRR